MNTTYDYIVVGAGSAGCALANRLTADPANKVLLLEAGGTDWDPLIHMPGGMLEIFKRGIHQWQAPTTPQEGLNNRSLTLRTGKVLGGSSSINGMLHIRGSARDYDRWSNEHGCEGWSYEKVLPFFRATETSSEGANEQRGAAGELNATSVQERHPTNSIISHYQAAAQDIGVPVRDDFCDGEAEGVGWTQATIKNGKRHSSAAAFLTPAKGRTNLTILTHAYARHIEFDFSSGEPVATGVTYQRKGEVDSVNASKEVILCAGALRSPQLLQVSGIGSREHLEGLGINVISDLPAVGENLHDHPTLSVRYNCSEPITMADISLFKQAMIGLKWLLFKKGIGSWNHFDANMFTRSSPDLDEADIQIQMIPMLAGISAGYPKEHGVTFLVCLLAETSRGTVKIRSKDMMDPPDFDLGFMTNPADLEPMKRGIRFVRKLAASDKWDGLLYEERTPGVQADDDEALEAYIRECVDTDYHYAGTCCMGNPDDSHTVVDPQLRVKGVKNLRVADASVMPLPMHGNTNHACIMIGAKAADMILSQI